jgi:Tol biopolymer transport system component
MFARHIPVLALVSLFTGAAALPPVLPAQDSSARAPVPATPRSLKFTTDEGTWMSLDVSPDGKTIVFDLLGDLYTLPIAGGTATRITEGPIWDSHPKFSPDGKRIAFVSDRTGAENLWIADADGKNPRAVTRGDRAWYVAPAWTPDGSAIIATRRNGLLVNESELWMYPVDGGAGVKLTVPGRFAHGPAFGGDDRMLYFAAIPGPTGAAGETAPQGTIQHQLFTLDRTTGRVSLRSGHVGGAIRPTLSRDGRWLAYVGGNGENGSAIFIRDLASGDERVLAEHAPWAGSGRTSDYMPGSAFTPDGRSLVTYLDGKLWSIDVTTGRRTAIPFTAQVEQQLAELVRTEHRIPDSSLAVRQIRDPRVSPDNRRVVFSALDRLWIADLPDASPNGTAPQKVVPRRLTTSDVGEFSPSWSPDGRSIAYVTWSDSLGGDLMRARAAIGSTPERVSSTRAFYDKPVFTADGARIAVERGSRQQRVTSHDELLRTGYKDVDLVWLPADCVATRPACATPRLISPITFPATYDALPGGAQFVTGVDRVYAYDAVDGLISMAWDGSDRRSLLKMTGWAWTRAAEESADEIVIAPNGKRALANVRTNLYLVDLIPSGSDVPAISTAKLAQSPLPTARLTEVGGSFPSFSVDGTRAVWALGPSLFVRDLGRRTTARYDIALTVPRDRPQGAVVLRNARVVTMKANEVIEKGDVLVVNDRIAAVGPSGTLNVPAGARSIDASGKTILPGYVDIHAHMWPAWGVHRTQPWEYLVNLAYGVTTTRDPQTMTTDVLILGDMVDAGMIVGPRILSTARGIFPSEDISSYTDARNIVRRYGEFYNTGMIKQYQTGDRKHRQWINMAAKEFGLNTTTEAGDFRMTMTLALDGYSGTEHTIIPFPLYKDVAKLLAASGITYTPTLIVTADLESYFITRTNPYADSVLTRFTPRWELDDRLQRWSSWMRDSQLRFPHAAASLATLVREGAHVGLGSHGNRQGLGVHWELWGYGMGGMPNHDILRAATIVSAEAIGAAADVGSIEVGKKADLQVLDRDPLSDIRNTNSIRWVMKNGRLYEAATLTEIWPRQKPLARLWWETPAVNAAAP